MDIKLIIYLSLSLIIFFLLVKKKVIKESFLSSNDVPYNIRKQIGTSYNAIILSQNQKNLPLVGPIETEKIDPYKDLIPCEINRKLKYYQGNLNDKNRKKSDKNKRNKYSKNKNKYSKSKKKFYDDYYGITLAPDSIKMQQKMIEDSKNKPIKFIQGNICKLSSWSLWGDCQYSEDCKLYGKKTRTRKVLNEPKGCYSPLNPVLKQTIPCDSSMCFCNSNC